MGEFKSAYDKTSIYEGGYANVKGDKGGETYKGISRVFNPEWPGWGMVDNYKPLKHNAIINNQELNSLVKQFYYQKYWMTIIGDLIEIQQVAEFLYDYYVHSGKRAIKATQRIVGVRIDGKVGNITIHAINGYAGDLFGKLKAERRQFLFDLSEKVGQRKFRNGWLNRVDSF